MNKRKKRTTITDVAIAANVSIATVSKIVNGKDQKISEETRQRVQELIKELEYIPNEMARSLKDAASRTIGLMIPNIGNAFPEMAQGAQDEAFERGYNLFLCSTESNPVQEERFREMLISKMVDGIIYISSNYETSNKFLSELHIPCVAIDRIVENQSGIGVVQIDNYQAMKEAAAFAVSKGCKQIGYITADITQSPSKERYKGFLDGLKECNVEFDQRLLYTGAFQVETGNMGAMALLKQEENLDCILCGNDLIAIGAMNVCQKAGKRIPQDIKIMGFDDIYISKYIYPELTTVRQNVYEMGRRASQMLIDHVENGTELSHIILPHELIERGSF